MSVYLCTYNNCNCIHGWSKDPRVRPAEKHERGNWEDIWHCPRCNKQHRTGDGTMMGQLYKEYREITVEDIDRIRDELLMGQLGGCGVLFLGHAINRRRD